MTWLDGELHGVLPQNGTCAERILSFGLLVLGPPLGDVFTFKSNCAMPLDELSIPSTLICPFSQPLSTLTKGSNIYSDSAA